MTQLLTPLMDWKQKMTPHHILLAIVTVILGVAATFGVKATLDNWRDGQWRGRRFWQG